MIAVICADITTLRVDAIVNAANSGLRGGGGVDGAIHRAAGPQLLEHCRMFGGCPTGEARITPGFHLPSRWVIHAVGPVWHGGDRNESTLLAHCYASAFELALAYRIGSVAFPAISTGAYGFPKLQAARIAIGVMRKYKPRVDMIVPCLFSYEDALVYHRVLDEPPMA